MPITSSLIPASSPLVAILHVAGRTEKAALSPDARWAVTVNEDSMAEVWDVRLARQVGRVESELLNNPDAVAVSADGEYLLTIGGDQERLSVWETGTGDEVEVHRALADGAIWTAAGDGSAVRGSPAPVAGFGGCLAQIRQPAGSLATIGFGDLGTDEVHDARQLALRLTPLSEGTVGLMETRSGQALVRPFAHESAVDDLALSDDGTMLASVAGSVKVWSTADGAQSAEFAGADARLVAFSPGGEVIALGNRLRAWAPGSPEPRLDVAAPTGSPVHLVVEPGGGRAIAGELTAAVDVWDLSTGAELPNIVEPMGVIAAIALTPDASHAAVIQFDRTIRVWDLTDLTEAAEVEEPNGATHVAITPDGQTVAAVGLGSLRIAEVRSPERVLDLETAGLYGTGVALTPGAERVVAIFSNHLLEVWDVGSARRIASFLADSPFTACAISPDGLTIAGGDVSGAVHILRLVGVEPIEQRTRRQPDEAEVARLVAEAEAHWSAGRAADALDCYQSALDLDPRHGVAMGQRCHLLYQLGRFDECVAAVKRAIEDPALSAGQKANLEVLLGGIAFQRDDPDGALDAFRSATERDPDSFDAHHNAGLALTRLHRLDEALDALAAARSIEDRPEVALQIAQCLLQLDRDAEAVAEFEGLLDRGYERPRIHYLMAMSLAALGRIAESHRSLERFIEAADPADAQLVVQARQLLGR